MFTVVAVGLIPAQPVLEGLNACLDHRAELFVPELNTTFKCPPSFRVFGAQNPLQVRKNKTQ